MGLRGHHRAATTAVDETTLLVVRYGEQWLALPSDGVRGVLTKEEAGSGQTVNWVGVTYNEADLAGLMDNLLDPSSPELRTVLYATKHAHAAIRVDEVVGLIDVERSQCHPLPAHFRSDERGWVMGYVSFQDRVVLMLNPEWVVGELGEVVSPAAITSSQAGG